jgi:hypothetical protein
MAEKTPDSFPLPFFLQRRRTHRTRNFSKVLLRQLDFGLYAEHEKLAALQAATQALLKQIGFIAADGYLTFAVVGDPLPGMCSQQSWQVSSPGGQTGAPAS